MPDPKPQPAAPPGASSDARREAPMGPPALHAPWRQTYIEAVDAQGSSGSSGSFLRDYWLTPERDTSNHVVVRTGDGLILLNRFPYAGGHLLVALGEARPSLLDYDEFQRAALWRLVDMAAELMQRTLSPQGVNIGVNQGRAAGAGVPQHLHVHLIPRWSGDVNFMATVGQVRMIHSSLDVMASRYREAYAAMAR